MSLANGRSYLAIPGPSVTPDRVQRAMLRASPNIYSGELVEMVPSIFESLRKVARTEGHVALYIANGHGAWEAAAANVFSRGDTALVLATGSFAHGWAETVRRLGVNVRVLDFGRHAAIDPARVTEALAADTAHEIRAVLCVQVDTATSIRSDMAAVRATIDAAGHPALLMVDSIACLACDRMEMDAWGVDVLLTGSQKGLMCPPGLGFVFFNDRADAARERADCVTWYWDWRRRVWPSVFYEHFGGTPPTLMLYGLRAALDMIEEEGLEAIWDRHATLARAAWAAFEAWGTEGPLRLNVADRAIRSHAVTTVTLGSPAALELQRWTEGKAGVTLGIGMGRAADPSVDPDHFFRLGHMGHVNAHMLLGALGTIEAGLTALGVPHGKGALEAAAAVVAGA